MTVFDEAAPMAEAFCKLLGPGVEVVMHDLKSNTVAAIHNPVSGRKVGDPSHLERWDFTIGPDDRVIGPYPGTNAQGESLESISVVLRDEKGEAVGLFCVNKPK